MVDFTGLRSGILASFGEPVIATVSGADFPLTVAFLEPYVGTVLGGVAVNRPNPQLLAHADDWLKTRAKNGDRVLRAGMEYTVVSAEPSDDGTMLVNMRRYQS